MSAQVRAVALAVVRRNGTEILVFRAVDETKTPAVFFRPFGGGIEFGETSEQALRRELREELGVDLEDVALLGVLENLFVHRGARGHEICFIYEGRTADGSLEARDSFTAREANGEPMAGCWIDITEPENLPGPVYPSGLLDLLAERRAPTVAEMGPLGDAVRVPPPRTGPGDPHSTSRVPTQLGT